MNFVINVRNQIVIGWHHHNITLDYEGQLKRLKKITFVFFTKRRWVELVEIKEQEVKLTLEGKKGWNQSAQQSG